MSTTATPWPRPSSAATRDSKSWPSLMRKALVSGGADDADAQLQHGNRTEHERRAKQLRDPETFAEHRVGKRDRHDRLDHREYRGRCRSNTAKPGEEEADRRDGGDRHQTQQPA